MNSSVVLSVDLAKLMNPARYAYAILLAVTASNIGAFFSRWGADVKGGSSSACRPRIFGIEVRLHSPIAYRPEPVIMNRTTLSVPACGVHGLRLGDSESGGGEPVQRERAIAGAQRCFA
jgi:hypothetical protein